MAAPALHGTELLSCPPLSKGGLARDIRDRGNIPVNVGSSCVIELTPGEIAENWASARSIRKPVVAAMIAEIAHRLSLALTVEDAETETLAAEAAACLFLSLHHRNLSVHEALEGCRIVWDGERRREIVEYLS
ncbi:MAG: hypothetical protein LCH46_02660 [Proteobacteria bacterium]|nr:hypothetical protein [Pseudomonadota bacterium]